MNIVVKYWVFRNAQDAAGKYNRTLVWDNAHIEHPDCGRRDEKDTFVFYGEYVRETEKAIQYNLKYWNLNKAGRYITDAPVEDGWMAWIPKSAIISPL